MAKKERKIVKMVFFYNKFRKILALSLAIVMMLSFTALFALADYEVEEGDAASFEPAAQYESPPEKAGSEDYSAADSGDYDAGDDYNVGNVESCEADCVCELCSEDNAASDCYCEDYACEACNPSTVSEAPEPSIAFVKSGVLVIEMHELYGSMDTNALLLRDISAFDEIGNDVSHLIEIKNDGGFAEYVATNFANITPGGVNPSGIEPLGGFGFGGNSPVIQPEGYTFETVVIYKVVHPESGDNIVTARAVNVRFMGVVALNYNQVSDEDSLRAAVDAAVGMGQVEIELMADITLSNGSLGIPIGADIVLIGNYALTINANAPVIIVDGIFTLNGPTITRDPGTIGTESRGVFVNGNFVMESGIIEGHASEAINPGALVGRGGGVFVNSGTFVMHGGYIRNNEAVRGFASGGGVFVDNGTFVMYGGTISNNRAWGSTTGIGGGGVTIFNNTTFEMRGGYIRDNTSGTNAPGGENANNGGGVSIGASSTFTLHSGNIIGNWANGRGGGVYTHWSLAGGTGYMGMNNHLVMHGGSISGNTAFRHSAVGASGAGGGGGVFIGNNTSTFVMHGGSISGNRAHTNGGGVYSRNATVTINSGGTIQGNHAYHTGGGMIVADVPPHASGGTPVREVYLRGGSIADNTAAMGGGGVNVTHRTFNIYSGEISRNRATNGSSGGGITTSSATVVMHNGTIGGNTATAHGGGILANGTTITIHNGKITQNTAIGDGGGIHGVNNSTITMADGGITNNTTINGMGGGVFVASNTQVSTFTMNGGVLSGNNALHHAGGLGGGVALQRNSVFNMNNNAVLYENEAQRGGGVAVVNDSSGFTMSNNAVIRNNTAREFGGGVYTRALATMNGGEMYGNTANYGGGVYVALGTATANGRFNAGGQSRIVGNTAVYDGGGIFTANYSYQDPLPLEGEYTNLIIASTVVFGNNSAQVGFRPPSNVITLLSIQFASTSIFDHPLNNFDINFRGTPLTVTYVGNGHTGGVVPVDLSSPYVPNTTVTVLGHGDLTRAGYTFQGWRKGNVGELWQAGNTFTITDDVVFYAQWERIPTFTVTYYGNGHTSGSVPMDINGPYLAGASVTVMGQGSMTRAGYTFQGWRFGNVGELLHAGDIFTMPAHNVTLYAQWERMPTFTITYYGNGHTGGSVPIDSYSPHLEGTPVIVLGQGNMTRDEYKFLGWRIGNTGELLQAGDVFTMPAHNITLYAQWERIPPQVERYNPQTGDFSNPMLWVSLILSGGMSLTLIIWFMREKRKS